MEHKTRTKVLSWLLALAMVVGLVPGMSLTAYAAMDQNKTFKAGDMIHSGFPMEWIRFGDENNTKKQVDDCTIQSITYNETSGKWVVSIPTVPWEDPVSLTYPSQTGKVFVGLKWASTSGNPVTNGYYQPAAVYEDAPTVAVIGVTLNKTSTTLTVGGTETLTATVAPNNATDKKVKWSVGGTDTGAVKLYTDEACTTEVGTDATETLTVYAKGESAGGATVTVTSNADSTKAASCDVTVNAAQTQTEELLTTITATGQEQASYDPANVATVSFSYTANGSLSYTNNTNWGWWGYGWTATVTPADGYTITKCVFYDDANRTATDSEAPFVVETTKEDKTPQVNGTPILAYTSKGITKIEVYGYATPASSYSVTITPGSNMTKTDASGATPQSDLSGAMTDVVYTADEGYYFPTDYSVAEVNGIFVTRNSYTQITVSGTPTADAAITLTAPTAKTTPDAPTAAAATDCTTADNNDGTLTGVTAEMEYKKSDAADWTAGTGSDITGLVPGTYYVRVKATDTTLASDNQELTVNEAQTQTEELLTTLTFGGSSTYSETTSGVVSVTAANVTDYNSTYGWLWYREGSLSVTAKEGYTITKCVFRQNAKTPITDTEAPFEIHYSSSRGYITEDTKWSMDGVTSIEVYGYASKAAQTITAEDVTVTYGDTDKSVSATVTEPTTGGGAISYAVKDGSEDYIDVASDGKLTIKKVPSDGKAYVTVTVAATDDYAQAAIEVTVTINAKAMTVSASDVTVTEDGQPHGITVTVTDPSSGYTVKYGETQGTYDLDASPTQTEVGTLTVYYQVTAENYTTYTGSATVTVRNKPAPPAPTTYSVTVNNGTGGGSYTAGATVTITADAAPEGKVFDKWTGSVSFADATSASTTFTMPASAVTVTATYKDKPSIADMTVYDIPDQSSTGEQITPKPVVKYLGYLLTEGTDYELSYGKNTELGEGTVTITGKGNYTGSLTKTFKIVLAAYEGTLTVTAPGTYTYGDALGAAPAVTSSAGSLSGETVKVYYSATPSGEGTAWSSGEVLNAGTYYVWAELAKTAAHDAATSARVTFTVSKATPAAPAGVLAASYADTYKVTLSIPGDKTYADYEYSLDGTNWTSVPALKDGAFTPAGLSAGTAYTLSLRTKADSNHNASPAATATLKTPAKVLLSYDANGSTATVPASAEYDSGATVTAAAITRAGYTFAGWNTAANGGAHYEAGAAFTISANTTLYAQWTPNTYNVTYHGNGTADPAAVNGAAYNAEITLPTPTYAEHTFNGWATVSGGNPVYRGGQKVTGLTSVSGATVDLYAVWTENTYKITGEVKEERDGTTEQSIVAGVTVKIMRGSVEFAATTTDDYGKYTFSGVPAGSYNIVATRTVDGKNQTMTALVEVKSDKTVETIVLPPSGVNSALKVTGDSTPPVMVGGLDDVAKDEAEENKEVTVTMTVEQKDENTATEQQKQEMEEIKEAVAADSTTDEGSTELEFLDVKVEKKTEDGSTTTTEPITETSQVVEMIVPFNMNGRFGFSLYRHHDGKAEAFRSMSSRFAKGSFADGYFFADKAAGLFYIYASRFSTYAIGYEEGTGYTLTVNNGTGSGEFAVGATITITADDPAAGKVFDKWTTGDGVSFANANSSTTTFTMPAKNVTVTATYKTASSPAPYYPGGGGNYTPTTYPPIVADAQHGKVTVSPTNPTSGTTVTITAKPDAGYEVDTVTVADASGKSVSVKDNGNNTYTFTQPGSKVTVNVTFKPEQATPTADVFTPYNDLDKTKWYADGIRYVLENGIMSGYGNGTFGPNNNTSRAMMAQILFNIEGGQSVSDALKYSDVNGADWYAEAIRWASTENIMDGYGNGVFGPNDAMTREQLVTIMYRYAKKKGIDVSMGEDTNILSYDDAFDVSEWAIPAMQWAVGSGLISGRTASTLNPQDKATRAEIATIIMRYCEEIAK